MGIWAKQAEVFLLSESASTKRPELLVFIQLESLHSDIDW